MSGIAGIIDWKNPVCAGSQAPTWGIMQRTLKKRGPDEEGIYVNGHGTFIHTRLNVIDPENGRQPMVISEGGEEYALVYNGELYNTEELRAELSRLGHRFLGYSDTEVLLHAYVEWGEHCVGRLNGIFAFAVWEHRKGRLFLARDRLGVKPLFYTQKGDVFLFASEIKALLAHPLVKPEIDEGSIAEIMLIGPGRTPQYGVFRGIEEVPPAFCGFYKDARLTLRPYWKLEDGEHTDNFQQTTEKIRNLVIDAVTRQLVSDVPVGTFLSGGLDSSIIASIAKPKICATFSVDFANNEQFFTPSGFQPENDYTFIEQMNSFLGVKHHRTILETDALVSALYDAVDARDLPGMADIDASLLLFSKEAKKHVTVALSGECADEVFGGYPWYRDPKIRNQDGFPWAQSTDYRASFLTPDYAKKINAHQYVDERYKKSLTSAATMPGLAPEEKRMKEMVHLNLQWFMQTLLERKDRMSMYNGLEVRVPFCDHRIVEYLYTIPWEMKNYQNREKGLLREAMRGLLPEDILWRKKSPYPKTHHPGYLEAVSKKLKEEIADPNAPVLQFVRKDALEALLQTQNPTPWYGQLMTTPQTIAYFLQINYWLKKYRVEIV